MLREEGELPRILLLQMDNTVKENKNNQVIAFCAALVHYGICHEVRLYFLLVGHTHIIIDQRFSVLHRHISTKDAFTLKQLIDELASIKFGQKWAKHKEVKAIRNYDWLLEYSHKFEGLGTVNVDGQKFTAKAIRLARDHSQDGSPVCLTYKANDTPAEDFIGHWSSHKPLPVFDSGKGSLPSYDNLPDIKMMPRRWFDILPIEEKLAVIKVCLNMSYSVSYRFT